MAAAGGPTVALGALGGAMGLAMGGEGGGQDPTDGLAHGLDARRDWPPNPLPSAYFPDSCVAIYNVRHLMTAEKEGSPDLGGRLACTSRCVHAA